MKRRSRGSKEKVTDKKEPDFSDDASVGGGSTPDLSEQVSAKVQEKKVEPAKDVAGDAGKSDEPASKESADKAEGDAPKQAEEIAVAAKDVLPKQAEEEVMAKEDPVNVARDRKSTCADD
eukprot:UN01237